MEGALDLPGFTQLEESAPVGSGKLLAAVGQPLSPEEEAESTTTGKAPRELRPALTAVQLGKGTVIRVGLPEWPQRLRRPDVSQVTRNIVDILRGVQPRIRSDAMSDTAAFPDVRAASPAWCSRAALAAGAVLGRHRARARVGDARRARADAGAAGRGDLELAADRVRARPRRARRWSRPPSGWRRWARSRACSRAAPACSASPRWPRCRSACPVAVGREHREPARPALRRDRRGRAGVARPAPRRAPRRRSPRERSGALEWVLLGGIVLYALQAVYAEDSAKALEQVVFFYVPFALLFALLRGLEWTPRRLAWGGGALVVLALVFAAIGFWEFQTRQPAAEPEGDRLQPGRGVLPRQLAVLRPEHLRALPRAGDDRAGERAAVGASGRASLALDDRRARRPVGRADDDALAVELRRAAARPGGAGRGCASAARSWSGRRSARWSSARGDRVRLRRARCGSTSATPTRSTTPPRAAST